MRDCLYVLLPAAICIPSQSSAIASVTFDDSAHFVVRSFDAGPSATEVLQQCDSLRRELQRKWLSDSKLETWKPRCEIVIHGTKASYIQSVGRGGASTSGSSLLKFDEEQIVLRRIDVLADHRGGVPALAHELTHVVLADRFAGTIPPRWADEGIALMADSVQKKLLHRRDCQRALQSGTYLRLVELMELERFSSPQQVAPFYGQSLSLVSFLVERDSPATFVSFIALALDKGYDYALRQTYGIDGVALLERQWRSHLSSSS